MQIRCEREKIKPARTPPPVPALALAFALVCFGNGQNDHFRANIRVGVFCLTH